MTACDEIKKKIERAGFKIINIAEDTDTKCVIDFKHPNIKTEEPVSYFLSSVLFNKSDHFLRTTVRSKVNEIKEVYFDYCCENGGMRCRPHIYPQENIFSVEASFRHNPLGKFDRLLWEMV